MSNDKYSYNDAITRTVQVLFKAITRTGPFQ